MRYARRDWVSRCDFHPHDAQQLLGEILEEMRRHARAVVVFDIDSTLYEVQPRTLAILKEIETPLEQVKEAVSRIELGHVRYSVKETLHGLGVDLSDPSFEVERERLKEEWKRRFFSNEFLKHDLAYPGACEFVREVHNAGATVVYLTGRDEPCMGQGTREVLQRDGFPVEEERIEFRLKDARDVDDFEHKVSTAPQIQALGQVVASFENEPRNLVALMQKMPEAKHVFLDTVCSEHPVEPVAGLFRLEKWK